MILGFGSGISTLCLTRYMFEVYGDTEDIYVLSFEENKDFVKSTTEFLSKFGLEKYSKFIWSPLVEQVIEGRKTICYSINFGILDSLENKPELVIIDGPSGIGERFGTIPLIKNYVSNGAIFLLDDALRDREIRICQAWSKLNYINLHGIVLIEKGIAIVEIQ